MFRKNVVAALTMLLSALFVQSNASAQTPANYRLSQSFVHLKADVPSYAFNLVTRRRLSDVHGQAAGAHNRAQPQRTPNHDIYITDDRNLEGYPQPCHQRLEFHPKPPV
jgi:hypothetical protein